MAQEARHIFTKEEGGLGVKNSRLGRRAWMKLEEKLAKLNLEKETVSKLLELAKVIIAQPGGVFLVGWLAIDGLERIGYFGSAPTSAAGQSPPLSPNQKKAGDATNNFLSLLSKSLPPGLGDIFAFGATLGGNAVNPGVGNVQGPLGAGLSALANQNAAVDAAFLKSGLFLICMTQALGGGQGIATLGTAAIAALK